MHCRKLVLLSVVLSALSLILVGCGPTKYAVNGKEVKPIYLRNNIHFQAKGDLNHGSYANWTEPTQGHAMLPVNTVVDIAYKDKYFIITDKSAGTKVEMIYEAVRMGMSVEQYINLITSSEPVPLETYSEIDRKGIADGKAYLGMSKDGIRTALGYPAAHKTPSLSSNTWVYWRGRLGIRSIDFDDNGKVIGIR